MFLHLFLCYPAKDFDEMGHSRRRTLHKKLNGKHVLGTNALVALNNVKWQNEKRNYDLSKYSCKILKLHKIT